VILDSDAIVDVAEDDGKVGLRIDVVVVVVVVAVVVAET